MLFRKKTERPDTTEVSNAFITNCLPSAPEVAVKVYLYGLMLASLNEPGADICAALGLEERDVRAAFSYLEQHGLVEVADGEEPVVVFKNAGESMLSAPSGSAAYSKLVDSVQAVLGTRVLTGAELSRIFDWVEVFGFEQEAAVGIVRNCLDRYGTKTTVAYMDKVAKTLAAKGAFTLGAVNEHFREEELFSTGAAKIRRRWNRRGAPTNDEIALYEKWTVGWGFDEAAIDYALTKMTAADKPSFAYLDSVIDSLRREGNIDREHIAELSKQEDMINELARAAFARADIKRSPKQEDKEFFRVWKRDYHMDDELILCAADLVKGSDKAFKKMKETIETWHNEGISSVAAAKESFEKNRIITDRRKKNTRSLNYIQGKTYSEDELRNMGISLGEEFYDNDDR